jgi:peptidoglycan/xylan/chitin deacetylase (PgdA/CDA1 family)
MVIAVPILGYHSVGDEPRDGTLRWSVPVGDFDEQLALLRQRRRTPLTVGRYAALLREGARLPPAPVLVTFDDGYADLATAALPVLVRYRIPATAYVITGWLAGARPGGKPVGGRPGGGARARGRPAGGARARSASPSGDPMLHWDQLAELDAAGVEIGSHSHTHRALDCLRPAELRREVSLSRWYLQDRLQQPVTSFAYPYGYHGPAVRAAVCAAGYTSACAVKNALSHPGDDVYALARVLVERTTGAAGIEALLDGLGRPVSWRGERLATRCWRVYRRTRHALVAARYRSDDRPERP